MQPGEPRGERLQAVEGGVVVTGGGQFEGQE